MNPSPEDEIRFIEDAVRLLRDDVGSHLLSRGWAVVDLDVGDEEPLEWSWPPTAPVGYGGLEERGEEVVRGWPQPSHERRTPWTVPTRISATGGTWTVRYGRAVAQEPDTPTVFAAAAELLADLERIECWPVDVDETRRIQAFRLLETTTAAARDDHHRAVHPTEPYTSRMAAIRTHQRFEHPGDLGPPHRVPPPTPRPHGDLGAQLRLLDAQAWASAVRTARAGGAGWGIDGPDPG